MTNYPDDEEIIEGDDQTADGDDGTEEDLFGGANPAGWGDAVGDDSDDNA